MPVLAGDPQLTAQCVSQSAAARTEDGRNSRAHRWAARPALDHTNTDPEVKGTNSHRGRRVAVVAVSDKERQQRGHRPLVDVIDGVADSNERNPGPVDAGTPVGRRVWTTGRDSPSAHLLSSQSFASVLPMLAQSCATGGYLSSRPERVAPHS